MRRFAAEKISSRYSARGIWVIEHLPLPPARQRDTPANGAVVRVIGRHGGIGGTRRSGNEGETWLPCINLARFIASLRLSSDIPGAASLDLRRKKRVRLRSPSDDSDKLRPMMARITSPCTVLFCSSSRKEIILAVMSRRSLRYREIGLVIMIKRAFYPSTARVRPRKCIFQHRRVFNASGASSQ